MKAAPHLLLIGNGPYANRGCEAIVRGTVTCLSGVYGEDLEITVASFATGEEFEQQVAAEVDPRIRHVRLHSSVEEGAGSPLHRTSHKAKRLRARLSARLGHRPMWLEQLERGLDLGCLDEILPSVYGALQVGGDNYSLDYGVPARFMRIDHHLEEAGIPVVLWGASVGPFTADPRLEKAMAIHLKGLNAIFVRESRSQQYLRGLGVSGNTWLMPDPAFLLEAVEPDEQRIGCSLPTDAIGVNLSPLMAQFVTRGDPAAWLDLCVGIVESLATATGLPIVLIPHATRRGRGGDDQTLLREIADRASTRTEVTCVGRLLNAAETKWVVSRCRVFVGARMHATIASMSSGVPTLSLAYSTKAFGLNRDVLGTLDYCLSPDQLSPAAVAERVLALLDKEKQMRALLLDKGAQQNRAVREAGRVLADVLAKERAPRVCACAERAHR